MPLRVFSARAHPQTGNQAVFFCYTLPAKNQETGEWNGDAGYAQWYLFDVVTEKIEENTAQIESIIRSTPDTPRVRKFPDAKLADIRKKVETHIKNTYLRSVQAPVGVKPVLKAWMELN